ncbi:DUF742 domain-containing protein [Streptomyces tardus]|nr:DUF742 domain-containing protein [Streptomyces tardus]
MSRGRQRTGMVRSYTPTGGVARPTRRTLDDATLLMVDEEKELRGLEPEPYRVMELCRPGRLSLAEVSYHLHLPRTVTTVIVAHLVDSGHLIARAPVPAASVHDTALLERILDGLHAL